jgi:hypothetical protein
MYAEINKEFYVFLTRNLIPMYRKAKDEVILHMKLDKNSLIRLHESEILRTKRQLTIFLNMPLISSNVDQSPYF